MVTMFVKKIVLIILVNIFFMRCYALNENENNSLLFENLLMDKFLPIDFSIINKNIITDSVLFDKKTLMYFPNGSKIVGSMFDFLCDLNLINGWDSYVDIDEKHCLKKYKNFVESRRSDLNLYFIGKIVISKEFQSFIILSIDGNDDEYNWVRNLYLMNVSDHKCRSLTRISCYACFDGECLYLYTERIANDFFILREEDNRSNSFVIDEIPIDSSVVKFMYDEEGMVEILSMYGEN